jgi:hypothetical protein
MQDETRAKREPRGAMYGSGAERVSEGGLVACVAGWLVGWSCAGVCPRVCLRVCVRVFVSWFVRVCPVLG